MKRKYLIMLTVISLSIPVNTFAEEKIKCPYLGSPKDRTYSQMSNTAFIIMGNPAPNPKPICFQSELEAENAGYVRVK